MFSFLVFTAFAALASLLVVVMFFVILAKLVFGLAVVPLRLAAAGAKLLFAIPVFLIGLPLLVVGAPLLGLFLGFAITIAPAVLVLWLIVHLIRGPARPVTT